MVASYRVLLSRTTGLKTYRNLSEPTPLTVSILQQVSISSSSYWIKYLVLSQNIFYLGTFEKFSPQYKNLIHTVIRGTGKNKNNPRNTRLTF